ncbi:MAG: hypothetical protein SGILL_002620 [Bacillariaceae sp.]
MAVPPAKIKAHLASIKGEFLDDNIDGASSVEDVFEATFKMELLLRGVMVQDDKKLWSQIQDSVGKNLVTDLPKPLLAGMNVVAGRLMEKVYHQLQQAAMPESTDRSTIIPKNQIDGAMQRAKDIEDKRWLILLSPEHKTNNEILQIALGYFSTAAQIQSDTPPMWKKVWDTWTLLRHTEMKYDVHPARVPPFEAQVAIEHLVRIAASKGNAKRAADLQLRLVQSFLNTNRITLIKIAPQNKKKNAAKTVLEYFGDTSANNLDNDLLQLTQKAVTTINECQTYFEKQLHDPTSSINETLEYQALKVQAFVMQQDAKIQKEAKEMYDASQNRSPGKTTLEECVRRCLECFLVTSDTKNTVDPFQNVLFLSASMALRDSMIAFWGAHDEKKEDAPASSFEQNLCFYWVQQSAKRLGECAGIIGDKTGSYYNPWKAVLDFVLPVLSEVERHDREIGHADWLRKQLEESVDIDGPSSTSAMLLISTCVSMLPEIYWMMLGDCDIVPQPLDSHMLFATKLLSLLIQTQEATTKMRTHESKTSSAIGAKDLSIEALRMRSWKHAQATASCLVCSDSNNPELISQITREAILSSKRKDTTAPLGLLRCFVAWGGWYQRPWPYSASLSDTRRILSCARSGQGRPLTKVEEVLLDLASADAELLNGGFADRASQQYSDVLLKLEKIDLGTNVLALDMLQVHCYNGLAQSSQIAGQSGGVDHHESTYTHLALEKLGSLKSSTSRCQLSIWHLESTFCASKAHQLSVARQLTAEVLVQQGQPEEAMSFLEAAVTDAPLDAEAAVALGAFLLWSSLYSNKGNGTIDEKSAQVQLLKAAKLDPTKSNPFALLGLWFACKGDSQRALGCFKKSLRLDPCNPVAGRGILRLQGDENIQDFLDNATEHTSASNGWAWYAVGLNKAYKEGHDELAVVAILKGLRCRDVAQPKSEKLGSFFSCPGEAPENEKAAALADVASCYRRLGRFTACIRAYHASIASAGDRVPSPVLLSCAQVELELGLFDDAVEKFSKVIERGEDAIALLGHASALSSIAHRDLMDGKASAAMKLTGLAIESCLKSSIEFGCQQKLLGDLYSLGAQFPPNVFGVDDMSAMNMAECLRNQLFFIAKGEQSYQRCFEFHAKVTAPNEEVDWLKSCVMCDRAVNILLQAQVLSSIQESSGPREERTRPFEADEVYARAASAFREILKGNPEFAPSWCGLGVAVLDRDPLFAQHCFCRCIELDRYYPESYANLGFLFTSRYALNASRGTMEALTQVADTPSMWLNCAFILEQEATKRISDGKNWSLETILIQASDAYRASLQVTRNAASQLGLSITSRVITPKGQGKDGEITESKSRKTAFLLMQEYAGATLSATRADSAFQGIMNVEKGIEGPDGAQWCNEIFLEGKAAVEESSREEPDAMDTSSVRMVSECLDAGVDAKSNSAPTNESIASIQNQILVEPERADLWLSLAKGAIGSNEIDLALEATSRSAFMLSQQLHDRDVSSPVDAGMMSEAISLESWLHELTRNPVCDDESTSFDMQRALLMDPENAIAREGIHFEV